jgi:hypothetical protein
MLRKKTLMQRMNILTQRRNMLTQRKNMLTKTKNILRQSRKTWLSQIMYSKWLHGCKTKEPEQLELAKSKKMPSMHTYHPLHPPLHLLLGKQRWQHFKALEKQEQGGKHQKFLS